MVLFCLLLRYRIGTNYRYAVNSFAARATKYETAHGHAPVFEVRAYPTYSYGRVYAKSVRAGTFSSVEFGRFLVGVVERCRIFRFWRKAQAPMLVIREIVMSVAEVVINVVYQNPEVGYVRLNAAAACAMDIQVVTWRVDVVTLRPAGIRVRERIFVARYIPWVGYRRQIR